MTTTGREAQQSTSTASQSAVEAVPPYVDNLMTCVTGVVNGCSSMTLEVLQGSGIEAFSTLFCDPGSGPGQVWQELHGAISRDSVDELI
jgi:hypothetical protein